MEETSPADPEAAPRGLAWWASKARHYRQAIEDVLVSMAPQAANLVTGLATAVLIARGLGAAGMGQYALILSVCGLTAQLSDLGIGRTAVRFAARATALGEEGLQMAVLRWAFRIRMSLALLVSAGAFLLAPWISRRFWHAPELAPLVRIGLWIGILGALAAVPTVYFQSLKRFRVNATVTVVQTLLTLVGILALAVLRRWSVGAVIVVSVVTTGLGAFAFLVLVPKPALFALQDLRKPFRAVLAGLWRAPDQSAVAASSLDDTGPTLFAFYMLLSSGLVAVTLRADVWLMGYFLSKSEIGVYHVASRFTLPLAMLLGALNTALWPRASALSSPTATQRLLRASFKLTTLAAAATVVYGLLAPMLAPLLFGAQYAGAVALARWLCLGFAPVILTCPIGVIAYTVGVVRVYYLVNLLQFAVVVALDVALMPRIGATAAGISFMAYSVAGSALTALLTARAMRRHFAKESARDD